MIPGVVQCNVLISLGFSKTRGKSVGSGGENGEWGMEKEIPDFPCFAVEGGERFTMKSGEVPRMCYRAREVQPE